MCLANLKTTEPKIAKKDIKVFKVLVRIFKNSMISCESGTPFKGKIVTRINDIKTIIECEGIIYRDFSDIYFLTNNPDLHGIRPPDYNDSNFKYSNFKYSWLVDDSVLEISYLSGDEYVTVKCAYHTPYRNALVEFGETYKSELFVDYHEYKENDVVNIGLHSYKNEMDAKKEANHTFYKDVYECIIPKGSKYFEGFFGIMKSYASDTLKYLPVTNK